MKRLLVALLGFVLLTSTLPADDTAARSLKIAPLEYRATLEKAEIKKGFIDISNPDYEKIVVDLKVQGFRQIDDQGSLEFYSDQQMSAGVKLDFAKVTLGPREAIRVYFLLDASKLPTGDIFGAIFASVRPDGDAAAEQSVRVGALLMLTNGTPSAREAEVTAIDVPFWQMGERITGSYKVKNTADPSESTGFFPEVDVRVQPFTISEKVSSPLVFAGRERSANFELETQRFGLYRVSASFGESSKSQWVFVVNWRLVGALILLAVLAIAWKLVRGQKPTRLRFSKRR